MLIVKTKRFDEELEAILDFIAQDSLERALVFYEKLIVAIDAIPLFPKKSRKSSKLNDANVREMVFDGYVIVYKIYENKILVLGIFSQNLWEL